MSNVAYLPIEADRYGACVRQIYIRGLDVSGMPMRAQVRVGGDTPGVPLVDLATVTNGNAEGLRLVGVDVVDGLPISHVELVINETTMEGLPYVGEVGSATELRWDWQITRAGRKERIAKGEFIITGDGVTGADAAPTNRPTSYGQPQSGSGGMRSGASLTFGEESITVSIDGAALVLPAAAQAKDSADDARASAVGAGAARDEAQGFADAFAATDVVSPYDTYAAAAGNIGAIPANGYVLVFADEQQLGQRSLYQKVGGALQYRSVLGDTLPLIERRTAVQPRGVGKAAGLWVTGSDSLTYGAANSTVRTTLNAIGRANLGYGGPGYLSFDDDGAGAYDTANSGADWYHAGGIETIAIADGIYGKYSFDGRGQFCRGGDGAGNFGFTPRGAWKRARVYYLKGIAGSFKWRFGGTPESVATTITTTAGGLDLGYFDVDGSTQGASGLLFSAMTGDVAIFGADFIWDEAGYRPANIARFGRLLQDVAAQDSTFRRKWWAELKPAGFPFNAGMNDRMTRTPQQHYEDLTAIMADVQAAAPDCAITIIQSLDPADAETTYFSAYTAQKLRVAAERNVAFLDLRRTFGRYADAVQAGLMADGVHPNAIANALIGQVTTGRQGLATGLADPGILAWAGGGGSAEKMWRGDLPLIAGVAVTVGQRKRLFTIGLINPYPVAIVSLDVAANLTGSGAQTAKHVAMALTNGTIPNQAALPLPGATPTVTQTFSQAAGNGASIDFTVDVTIVNDRAEFGITANQAGTITCEGGIVFSALGAAGQSYFVDVG